MLINNFLHLRKSGKLFCKDHKREFSYKELFQNIQSFSSELNKLEHGKTALMGRNSLEFVAALLSLFINGIPVYLLSHKTTTNEIQTLIRNNNFKNLIYHPDQNDLIRDCDKDINLLPIIFENKIKEEFEYSKTQTNNPALFQFTSGTTGKSKIAGRSHESLSSEISLCRDVFNFTTNDLIYCPAPFFHAYGLVDGLLSGMLANSSFYMEEMIFTRKSFERLSDQDITIIISTPAFYKNMLNSVEKLDNPFKKLRKCYSAGARLDNEIIERFHKRFNFHITNIYGMTELGTVLVSRDENPPFDNLSGIPLPGYDINFFDINDSKILGIKKIIDDFHLISEETRKDNVINDYYITGDSGYLKNNNVYIEGRISDFINTGGEKISPTDIENIVNNIENIEESCAFGIPDKIYGQLIGLYINFNSEFDRDEKYIRNILKNELPPHKIPKKIILSKIKLPRTATGKILKGKLLELFSD